MSRKSQAMISLQSIKSMPVNSRFMIPQTLEESDDRNVKNMEASSLVDGVNGASGDDAVTRLQYSINNIDELNEDSPYNCNIETVEERPTLDDGEDGFMPLPSPSISASHSERRWDDTSSYTTRKVFWVIY